MSNGIRWTPEQLAEFQRRGTVRTNRMGGSEPEKKRDMPKESKLERRFDQQLEEAGLPIPRRNWFFLNGRDFELDRAWPAQKIAVEIQGMAHRIKGKFKRDIEKRALAMLSGWRVLEVDGASIRDGRAIAWTKQLLKGGQ